MPYSPTIAFRLLPVVLAAALTSEAAEPDAREEWITAGWQRTSPTRHELDQARLLDGMGTVTAPIVTGARVETMLIRDPALGSSLLINVLSASVSVDEGLLAYGFRVPLVMGPLPRAARVASGDLMLERHAVVATSTTRGSVSTRTWRLVLPAATTDQRLPAPGLQHIGAGLDWGAARFYVAGPWKLLAETAAGLRFDELMPIQASATIAASRSLVGPLWLFGQVDAFLMPSPLVDDRAALTAGGGMEIGALKLVLAMRALSDAASEPHYLLSATFLH